MFTNKFSTKTHFKQLINLKKQNEDSLVKNKKKKDKRNHLTILAVFTEKGLRWKERRIKEMVLFQDIISLVVFKCIGVYNNGCLEYMFCNMKMSLTLIDNECVLLFRKQYYVKYYRHKNGI